MATGQVGMMTALAPWFGGKRTLAPRIARQLGPHRVYWEPFCGSMAVLMQKMCVTRETVNDLHADLTNLARVVQHPTHGPALYRRLRRVLSCESLFRESQQAVRADFSPAPDEVCPDRAFHYFVASWQGLNGVAGTSQFNTGYARRFTEGPNPALRFATAVRSIPQWRRRMERVQVLRTCGLELCERVEDAAGTAIYADPPYLVKGAKYAHDFADPDHERLALALRRFRRARVVVSYYAHPRLAELYPGWAVVPVGMAKGMVNSGRLSAGRCDAPEVLLVNGEPVPDDGPDLFAGCE